MLPPCSSACRIVRHVVKNSLDSSAENVSIENPSKPPPGELGSVSQCPLKRRKSKCQLLIYVRFCDPMDCSLCSWDSPGKNTEVGYHFLLPGIFPIQGFNSGLPQCRQILYCLSHQGSPTRQIKGWRQGELRGRCGLSVPGLLWYHPG